MATDEKAQRLLSLLQRYLEPVPVPAGFTSREIVRRAIEFADPPRVPYAFVEPLQSDVAHLLVAQLFSGRKDRNIPQGEFVVDEWGIGWRGTGHAWGHAEKFPLADLAALDSYRFPEIHSPEEYVLFQQVAEAADRAGKYNIAPDPIGAYERLRSLMGFENLAMAPAIDPDRFHKLLGKLTEMTLDVIERFAAMKCVHAFMTWEDWGLQTGLQIRPAQWHEVYKPHYAAVIDACHRNGMHYILHSCGFIRDIIPGLIEIGVDVLQLDQPRLMGIENLARDFGGKICFWCPLDIQWSPRENVTAEELRAEARLMVEQFGRFKGGFIASQYLQPRDIDLSPERHQEIAEAFFAAGCR